MWILLIRIVQKLFFIVLQRLDPQQVRPLRSLNTALTLCFPQVDRSAAYAARWVAKSIVAAGLAKRVIVQVAYAIGKAEPMGIMVDTWRTNVIPEEKIGDLIVKYFDLTPRGIIDKLNLRRPIYKQTASYGHFGRDEPEFTWEAIDKAAALRADADL